MLETSTFGLRLRTRAQSRFLPLFLRAHHVFRGVLSPSGETPLSWTPAEGRAVSVSPRADPRFDWLGPPPVDEVGCSDLSLAASIDDDPTPQGEPFGLVERAIPIAPAPNAPPVALVHGGSFNVFVQERDGDAVRIAGRLEDGALAGARVSGWVDESALMPKLVGIRVAGATAAGVEASSDWTGCRTDHPLFVELDGRVERVGSVLAGTRVAIEAPSPGGLVRARVIGPSFREVPPPVRLVPRAAFELSRADAEDCR